MLRLASLYAVPVRSPPETDYQGQYHPVELLDRYDVGHVGRLITSFHKEGITKGQMLDILQNLPFTQKSEYMIGLKSCYW
jgi:hypothetical protein